MSAEPSFEQSERESARILRKAMAVQRDDLRRRLEFYEDREDAEPERDFCRAVLAEIDRETFAFQEAAERGAGWEASLHAWKVGRWTVFYGVWNLPDAMRGRSSVTSGAKGGNMKAGRHRHPPEQIKRAVQAHPRANDPGQWTNVTDWVGRNALRPPLSGRQVRRILDKHFPEVKW